MHDGWGGSNPHILTARGPSGASSRVFVVAVFILLIPAAFQVVILFQGWAETPTAFTGARLSVYPPPTQASVSDQLTFSTYLGGDGVDQGETVAVDANGNVYVVGQTAAPSLPDTPGFPVTPGAFDSILRGESDGFVAKFNATGIPEFITFLGGTGADNALDVAVDNSGSVYVSGWTDSTDFPTTADAFNRNNSGGRDGFLAKLSPDGANLLYASYIGGSGQDEVAHLALGPDSTVYFTGTIDSPDFPITPGAYDTTLDGTSDAYAARLDVQGDRLLFSTYLGGTSSDFSRDIAVDGSGSPIVVGTTDSYDFPTSSGAFDATLNGTDGFVVRLNADGTDLPYGSFFGGSGSDGITSLALDENGLVSATGYTASTDLPTTEGALSRVYHGGNSDSFLFRMNPQGALLYSTFVGGSGDDNGQAVAVDGAGTTYLLGVTSSTDFPTTSDAMSKVNRGFTDSYILTLDSPGTAISYSSYFGGSGWDHGALLAVDNESHVYVTGSTGSSDFPVTVGAFDTTLDGSSDAFVARMRIPKPAESPIPPSLPCGLLFTPLIGGLGLVAWALPLRSRNRRAEPGSHEPEKTRK